MYVYVYVHIYIYIYMNIICIYIYMCGISLFVCYMYINMYMYKQAIGDFGSAGFGSRLCVQVPLIGHHRLLLSASVRGPHDMGQVHCLRGVWKRLKRATERRGQVVLKHAGQKSLPADHRL